MDLDQNELVSEIVQIQNQVQVDLENYFHRAVLGEREVFMGRLKEFVLFLRQRRRITFSDLLLALTGVLIVGLLIIPMPPLFLDFLIAMNIAMGTVLLIVAIHIRRTLELTTLPALLLGSTLFRLALNVSTTRQILLQADAGAIIGSFGQFVAGANTVVGLAIFIIITVIQYLVIARGAGRVAEVAARFTLDALPGKQRAIQSDLEQGVIDIGEAMEQRRLLERESQLYGALDGAMKFVRGDTIAGIVIILVNIVGGLYVGLFQQGLDLSEASQIYVILTIGDGLSAQIPALLVSAAAGVVITRVEPKNRYQQLGSEVFQQLLQHKRALWTVSGLFFVLACIPQLPVLPFLIFSGASAVLALQKRGVISESVFDEATHDPLAPTPVLHIEVGGRAQRLLHKLQNEANAIALRIREEWGIPDVQIPVHLVASGGNHIALYHKDVPWIAIPNAQGLIVDENQLTILKKFQVQSVPISHSSPPLRMVHSSYENKMRRMGIVYESGPELIVRELQTLSRARIIDFLGYETTSRIVKQISLWFPALAQRAKQEIPFDIFQQVLHALISEGVPIKNLGDITSSLIKARAAFANLPQVIQGVRDDLAPLITHRALMQRRELCVFRFHPELEEVLEDALMRAGDSVYLALEKELCRGITCGMNKLIQERWDSFGSPVLLVSRVLRYHVRWEIFPSDFTVTVMAPSECSGEIPVRTLGVLTMQNASDDQ